MAKVKLSKNGLNSWQIMSSIFKPNIKPTEDEIKSINSFFFCRYLGANKHCLPIAAVINRNYNIPIETQYQFAKDYSDLVGLSRLVKFISYQKEKTPPELEQLLSNLERKYNITRGHAFQYFEIMRQTKEGQNKLNEIMDMYNEGIQ